MIPLNQRQTALSDERTSYHCTTPDHTYHGSKLDALIIYHGHIMLRLASYVCYYYARICMRTYIYTYGHAIPHHIYTYTAPCVKRDSSNHHGPFASY